MFKKILIVALPYRLSRTRQGALINKSLIACLYEECVYSKRNLYTVCMISKARFEPQGGERLSAELASHTRRTYFVADARCKEQSDGIAIATLCVNRVQSYALFDALIRTSCIWR